MEGKGLVGIIGRKSGLSDVGAKIAQVRKQRGYTQGQLAERAGLSASFVSRVESGLSGIGTEALSALADALDVNSGYLLEPAGKHHEDGIPNPHRAHILNSRSAAPGLVKLARDDSLIESLEITDEEFRILSTLDLSRPPTRDGYVQLLMTIRAISGGR